MKAPPDSEQLSLAASLRFIIEQLRGPSLRAPSLFEARVWRPLYRALAEGKLNAVGDFTDREGRGLHADQQVSPDDWRSLEESDFCDACLRSRVLTLPGSDRVRNSPFYLSNVRIETKQLRNWVGGGSAARSVAPSPQFREADLRKDVADYIIAQQTEGQSPTQRTCEAQLSSKGYPRSAIREEFKRQAGDKGLSVERGRPRKKAPR